MHTNTEIDITHVGFLKLKIFMNIMYDNISNSEIQLITQINIKKIFSRDFKVNKILFLRTTITKNLKNYLLKTFLYNALSINSVYLLHIKERYFFIVLIKQVFFMSLIVIVDLSANPSCQSNFG